MLADAWHDADSRTESQRQAESEWTFWIGSSCELPTDLTNAISEQLAMSKSFAPSDLLSDFEHVRYLEAKVLSELDASIEVPTGFLEFINYRFDWAAATLPDYIRRGLPIDMIDSCGESVGKALIAFEQRVHEETDQLFDDEAFDDWRELGILRERDQ